MKYLFCFLAVAFWGIAANAQTYDSTPPYQKDSTLPKFLLLAKDSTWFSTAQIPKKTPVVFIFFNPDCEHCQHEAADLSKNMNKLKDVYFVWATYEGTFENMKNFAVTYHLEQYRNIHFFKDPNFSLPSFYRLQMTPYIAAYNKHGKLVKTWEGNVSPEILAAWLR